MIVKISVKKSMEPEQGRDSHLVLHLALHECQGDWTILAGVPGVQQVVTLEPHVTTRHLKRADAMRTVWQVSHQVMMAQSHLSQKLWFGSFQRI